MTAAAAEQAILHLHQLGHRRIGMLLGPLDHIPSQRKLAAARPLLERLGAPLDDALVVRGLYSLESGQAGHPASSPPARRDRVRERPARPRRRARGAPRRAARAAGRQRRGLRRLGAR